MDHRRVVRELNLFDDLAIHIEPKERVEIGVGIPQCLAILVPRQPVRPVSRHRPRLLYDPGLGLHDNQKAGRRNDEIEQAILGNDAVGSCSAIAVLRVERQLAVRKFTLRRHYRCQPGSASAG